MIVTLDMVRQVLKKDLGRLSDVGYSTDEIYACVSRFAERPEKYEKALEALALRIPKSSIAHVVHSIRYRVKDPLHLVDKLRRECLKKEDARQIRAHELFDVEKGLYDLGGLRIIHLYKHQWREIHDYIQGGIQDDKGNRCVELVKKKAWVRRCDVPLYKGTFGRSEISVKDNEYSSLHYTVRYSPEICNCLDVYLEIQVRTLFEEGWGEIDHHVRYPFDTTSMVKAQLQILNRTTHIANDIATALERLNRIPVFLPWDKELDLEKSADAVYCMTQTLNWASTYTREFVRLLKASQTTYYFLIPLASYNSMRLKERRRKVKRALKRDLNRRVQFIPVSVPEIFFPFESDLLLLHNISTQYGDQRKTVAVLSAPAIDTLAQDEKLDIVMSDADSLRRICEFFRTIAPSLAVPVI